MVYRFFEVKKGFEPADVLCNAHLSGATEEFQQIFIDSTRRESMTVSSGLLDIEKLLCRGEYTYERGEPLEISALVKVGRTGSGEASVQLEVFRKKFCSYERIYSKKVRNIIKDSHESCTYTICIPGYETEEFNQEQQLKMRVRIALNGDSISKEVLWKVLEG